LEDRRETRREIALLIKIKRRHRKNKEKYSHFTFGGRGLTKAPKLAIIML
jgi:hypothetical protein